MLFGSGVTWAAFLSPLKEKLDFLVILGGLSYATETGYRKSEGSAV
jgi:hypothetical protein